MGAREVRFPAPVTRVKLIIQCSGIAVEGVIPVHSLVDGEECWLSNGVRGFIFGKIRLGNAVKPVNN